MPRRCDETDGGDVGKPFDARQIFRHEKRIDIDARYAQTGKEAPDLAKSVIGNLVGMHRNDEIGPEIARHLDKLSIGFSRSRPTDTPDGLTARHIAIAISENGMAIAREAIGKLAHRRVKIRADRKSTSLNSSH